MQKVFVSYSHAQGDWVWDRLVPCLKAGGAEVLIDRERFAAGKAVYAQMDAVQDQAEVHLLVLSKAYLRSRACRHEMARAIARDPDFRTGTVLPLLRGDCTLPDEIRRPNPLYVDLRDDRRAEPWALLLDRCQASLGTTAPAWLAARDDVVRFLKEDKSVNLVVNGAVKWRGLLDDVAAEHGLRLAIVDLENPATVPRHGLVATILGVLGSRRPVPHPPDDLPELAGVLSTLGRARVALSHFDIVPYRPDYDANLFSSLRYLVMDTRQLVLLIQSRTPFAALLPQGHPLSVLDLKTVELGSRA